MQNPSVSEPSVVSTWYPSMHCLREERREKKESEGAKWEGKHSAVFGNDEKGVKRAESAVGASPPYCLHVEA